MSVVSDLTKKYSFTMTKLYNKLRMSEKAANVQRRTSKDLQKVWLSRNDVKKRRVTKFFHNTVYC